MNETPKSETDDVGRVRLNGGLGVSVCSVCKRTKDECQGLIDESGVCDDCKGGLEYKAECANSWH